MASRDFFKRKSLLPSGSSARELAGSNRQPEPEPSETSLCDRPTVTPDVPAEVHARRAMEQLEDAERATARAPVNTSGDSPAAPEPETIEPNLDQIELDLISQNPPPTPQTLPAQEPPASKPNLPSLTSELVEDDLEFISELDAASALDFVDAHDRDAQIPEPLTLEDETASAPKDRQESLSGLYAVGDFSGALRLAEERLASAPTDTMAQRYAQSCRTVLAKMYSARIGSLAQVVQVAVAPEKIRWLSLDHRAGFLLSLVDGQSTVEDLLDISGMDRLDALKLIAELVSQHVVSLGSSDC